MAKGQKPRWLKVVERLEAEGKSLAAVDVPTRGPVRILLGTPINVAVPAKDAPNEWDEVLPGAA